MAELFEFLKDLEMSDKFVDYTSGELFAPVPIAETANSNDMTTLILVAGIIVFGATTFYLIKKCQENSNRIWRLETQQGCMKKDIANNLDQLNHASNQLKVTNAKLIALAGEFENSKDVYLNWYPK